MSPSGKSIFIFWRVFFSNCLIGAALYIFPHAGRQLLELPALLIDQLLKLIRKLVVSGSGSVDQMLKSLDGFGMFLHLLFQHPDLLGLGRPFTSNQSAAR